MKQDISENDHSKDIVQMKLILMQSSYLVET